MAITLDNPALFLDPDKIVEELNAFNTAKENEEAVEGAVASDATTNNLTHDSIYNTIKRSIISAVAKKKTYTIIPFTHFSPHTQEDINLLLGDVDETRTSFDELKGRWYETFEDTFKKLGYEYIFCYYRNEPLPFGVMVSWHEGTGVNGDANLKEAEATYSRFVYPKYYFFYPDVETTRENATNGSTDLTITEVIAETLIAVNSKINESIALNKKYALVFWEDIDVKNADYIKSQFYTTGTTDKTHIWSSTDEIALFADATANDRLLTIDKDDTFTMRKIVRNNHNDKAYGYRAIKNPKGEVLGFLVSWHDSTTEADIETEITDVINSFKTEAEDTASTLITLPIYNTAGQTSNRGTIRKNMRSSYLTTIAEKIQAKLSDAFNNSKREAVLLWTEVSSTKWTSVRTEWSTSDYFGKNIAAQAYDTSDEDTSVRTLLKGVQMTFPEVFGATGTKSQSNKTYDIGLEIIFALPSDVSANTATRVYWDYLWYKDVAEDKRTPSTSCGIVLYYAGEHSASTAIKNTQKDYYTNKEDPAK